MSLKEMQDLQATLLDGLTRQNLLQQSEVETLFHLPDSQEVQSMPMYAALARMIAWDVARPFRVWALRRRGMKSEGRFPVFGGILPARNPDLERAISLASSQAALSERILFLSKTHRIFHLWHVVHRPFSISLAIFAIIHVAVVTWLGYY